MRRHLLLSSSSLFLASMFADAALAQMPRGNTAFGTSAGQQVTGEFNTAVGTSAGQGVVGDFNTAVGTSAGQGAQGNNNVAVGLSAGQSVTGSDNVAIGTSAGSSSAAMRAVSVGLSAKASANDSVAIGSSSSATGIRSVVLGSGSSDSGASNVVSVGGAGAERRIVNVAQGAVTAGSTDAVTGSQLFATDNKAGQALSASQVAATQAQAANARANATGTATAAALGGGAAYDPVTGQGSGPNYRLAGASYSNVGSAFVALDDEISTLEQSAVRYDDASRGVATLGPTNGQTKLRNLNAGAVEAGSTEAVNGSQLHATNLAVEDVSEIAKGAQASADAANRSAAAVASGTNRLAASLGGGAAFDPASGTTTVPAFMVGGSSYGDVAAALTALDDEITGIGSAPDNSVAYDDASHASITLGGASSAAVRISNAAAGALNATSTDVVNGAQLHATNAIVADLGNALASHADTLVAHASAIAENSARLNVLATQVSSGTIGLVQQQGGQGSGAISVGAETGGTTVDVSGRQGSRTITGVAAGAVSASSTDAVNGAQLHRLATDLAGVAGAVGSLDNRIDVLGRGLADIRYDLRSLRKSANAGIAAAVALGALPQSTNPGRWAIGMGTGIRGREMAVSMGASWRSPDSMFVLNVRAGYDQSSVTAGAGLGLEF